MWNISKYELGLEQYITSDIVPRHQAQTSIIVDIFHPMYNSVSVSITCVILQGAHFTNKKE